MAKHMSPLKFVWPSVRADSEYIVRWMARKQVPRKFLNIIYNRLSYRQKSAFHTRFAKLFRCHDTRADPGRWTVVFHGREVSVPVDRETMWLDWDSALSVLGHEPEIKATYGILMKEIGCPRCVFDVGASYGLHSLLFLAHGVQVISFEPNSTCHEYFERLEVLNNLRFTVEPMALGSSQGTVALWYPERETWLGTTDPERAQDISSEYQLRQLEVPCMTLDGYVRQKKRVPDLIKLDTEGNELQILLGARHTMEKARPILIFECWRDSKREQMWNLLNSMGYVTVRLPLLSLDRAAPVGMLPFSNSEESNFAALPREKLGQ